MNADIAAQRQLWQGEKAELDRQLGELRQRVVTTQEEEILQEVGVYNYRHPLSDSVAYQDELQVLQGQIKLMAQKDGGAIQSVTVWSVNGSATEGRKMVRDISKLMLRAYNAEATTLSGA